QFMSLFYGEYDAAKRQLAYTNAGHPCPLLIRNGESQSLDSHGLLLGVLKDVNYGQTVLDLLPGDLLILYSDGISEAMSPAQELFRADRIIEAVRASSSCAPADVLQVIWSKVEQHAARAKELDDRTLLVLRIREEAGAA